MFFSIEMFQNLKSEMLISFSRQDVLLKIPGKFVLMY